MGPLMKKIGHTLYDNPDWILKSIKMDLNAKQSWTEKMMDPFIQKDPLKHLGSSVIEWGSMSDRDYVRSRILIGLDEQKDYLTGENLTDEVIEAVLSKLSAVVPQIPRSKPKQPKQQELKFDDKERATKPTTRAEVDPAIAVMDYEGGGTAKYRESKYMNDKQLIWEAYISKALPYPALKIK
jgi:hypothetical protein